MSLATPGIKLYLVRMVAAGRNRPKHGDLPLAEQPLNLGLCREVRKVQSQNLDLGELGSNPGCKLQVSEQVR